mmetsp:Transcript_103078/g.174597  ORF Transcript_103078/g.174597 Transcript_103078/m.174597 type:complete len:278 (-) Transcript_103078:216-1049(-)
MVVFFVMLWCGRKNTFFPVVSIWARPCFSPTYSGRASNLYISSGMASISLKRLGSLDGAFTAEVAAAAPTSVGINFIVNSVMALTVGSSIMASRASSTEPPSLVCRRLRNSTIATESRPWSTNETSASGTMPMDSCTLASTNFWTYSRRSPSDMATTSAASPGPAAFLAAGECCANQALKKGSACGMAFGRDFTRVFGTGRMTATSALTPLKRADMAFSPTEMLTGRRPMRSMLDKSAPLVNAIPTSAQGPHWMLVAARPLCRRMRASPSRIAFAAP